ncbi:hypothetical protein OBA27_01440 [Pelagibacteraceae bacterium]|nr:hypothetical protein [Pelagibacteraceae bacterium]
MNKKKINLSKTFCYRASAFNHIKFEDYKDTYHSKLDGFEFDKIHQTIYQNYIDIFYSKHDEVITKYFGLASVKIILLISHLIYDELLFDDLKNSRIDYVLSNKIDTLKKSIINSHQDMLKQFNFNNLTLKKYKAYLKLIKNQRNFNLNFKSIFDGNNFIYIGKKNNIISSIYSDIDTKSIILDNSFFYPITKKIKIDKLLSNKIDNLFKRIMDTYHLSDNSFFKNKLIKIKKDLEFLYNFMLTAQKLTMDKRCRGFYVHAIGHPINRFIAAGLRLSKNEVISDIHGNMDVTLRNSIARAIYGEFSICSRLIAKSYDEFKFANEVVEKNLIVEDKSQVILHSTSEINPKRYTKEIYRNDVIKNIMILGFPHKPTFTVGQPHLNSITQITFEMDLCNHLKSSGYKVFYKCHPDRIDEVRSVLKDKVDYFLTEKFEDCYSLCDCIFFTYASTTAFGFALGTEIPIVLFNFSTSDLNYENLTRIEKRCSISKLNFDKKGYDKININEINKLIVDAKNKILKN